MKAALLLVDCPFKRTFAKTTVRTTSARGHLIKTKQSFYCNFAKFTSFKL